MTQKIYTYMATFCRRGRDAVVVMLF